MQQTYAGEFISSLLPQFLNKGYTCMLQLKYVEVIIMHELTQKYKCTVINYILMKISRNRLASLQFRPCIWRGQVQILAVPMAIASKLPSHPPYIITFPFHLMLYNLYSW
jgi:hypothetical protein